jgi:ubiquinol-cytochrome c reductase cytochrome c subunit
LVAAVALAPGALAASGRQLYFAHCVWCHGDRLQGVPLTGQQTGPEGHAAAGPPLRGAGAAAADFYLRTGYMPLRNPTDQPKRSRPAFTDGEIRALVRFIGARGGPPIPRVHPERGKTSVGLVVFTEHCAGCHQVVGEGGIVTGARVPSLKHATATQIAEAVRVGPYVMPRFSTHDISQRELDSLVRYVLYAKDPRDSGGWGLEHLGPIPEGIVAWLLAGGVLLLIARLIGEGLKR